MSYLIVVLTTAKDITAILEKHAVLQSPSRIEELIKIFIHATKVSSSEEARRYMLMLTSWKMETGFWDMGAGQR